MNINKEKLPRHVHCYALLALSLFTALSTGQVSAQANIAVGPDDRAILIGPLGPTESSVQAGQILSGVGIRKTSDSPSDPTTPDSNFSATAYTLWEIEPASAARILQPMPVSPASNTVDIEFLEATTVTVTVSAFDQENAPPEYEGLDYNVVVYTFNVAPATGGSPQSTSTTSSLNRNQLAAQAALARVCSTNPDNSSSEGQTDLLSSCNSIAQQNDPTASLDRVAAEELFALGDAMTITADQHIGNIQSRIAIVRAGRRDNVDISGLNVQLGDQTIAGNILSAGKDALRKLGGGGASQDAIGQSALGMFASGTLSLGDIDGLGKQRNASLSTNSLTIGADFRLDESRVFGAALGIVNDTTNFTGDNGELDMQGISISAFGTWYEKDQGYADIIALVGQNDFDLHRRIDLASQPREFAHSSTDAMRTALSMSAGRTFQHGATELGPLVRVAIAHASISGFKETSTRSGSGAGTALDVESHSVTSIRFAIGGEVKRVIGLKSAVLVPSFRVEFETETETDKGTIRAAFVNDPDSTTMQFKGAQRSRSAALVSIGSTAVFKNGQSAFLSLDARTLDEHVTNRRIRIGYRVQF